MNENNDFENIEFVKVLKSKESIFLGNLQKVFEDAQNLLANRVSCTFSTYTLHDINHSIRVADYMYDIVEKRINDIEELDIVIMLYSAILHDIGMVVNNDEVEQIKNDNYLSNEKEKYRIQLSGIKNIDWIKNIEDKEEQHKYAFQEYIRKIHGFRAGEYIRKLHLNKDYFIIPKLSTSNFHEDLALICQSHYNAPLF